MMAVPPNQAYYYPPPQVQVQPFPPPMALASSRYLTPEVRYALVAAAVAFVVFSPVGEVFVDGLVERTPLRAHKFAARCLALGVVTFVVFEGLKRVA